MESSFMQSFYDTVENFVQAIFKIIAAFLALLGFGNDDNGGDETEPSSVA